MIRSQTTILTGHPRLSTMIPKPLLQQASMQSTTLSSYCLSRSATVFRNHNLERQSLASYSTTALLSKNMRIKHQNNCLRKSPLLSLSSTKSITTSTVSQSTDPSRNIHPQPDSSHLDFTTCDPSLVPPATDVQVFPGFLSPEEQTVLVEACDRKLKRLARGPYAEGHFDNVIKGYKEATISSWAQQRLSPKSPPPSANSWAAEDEKVIAIMDRFRNAMNDVIGGDQLPTWISPHILELREGDSGIGAHVDNVQASGDIVAGLCLLSPAVMIFRHTQNQDSYFSALLPPGCMYFQRGAARFNFTHEIPISPDQHVFKGEPIRRGRRISIMIRDELVKPPQKF
ncbi:Alpha-ketoglutarate-dependent dioxygenase alkB 7, mitochondrial [Blyttiomyces sp. JEL0837]|nr:Alpha-ketoglutarate-dependent dioxygenase alkB 7, mitochondrial [Blyttiomyces sp. JEL0837]